MNRIRRLRIFSKPWLGNGALGAVAPDQHPFGLSEGAASQGGKTRGEGMVMQPPGSFGVAKGIGPMATAQGASGGLTGLCGDKVNRA
jgi:hypothetical protein